MATKPLERARMHAPLVTTIIPVFNRAAMMKEAVHSVLAQTWRPIEIVIVDDASTDDTPRVADALANAHSEIRVIRRTVNGGPGAGRESGRVVANGDFIQHLDSDDLLLPRKFELQVAALLANPECGAAYGWTRMRFRDGSVHREPWKRSGERIDTMFPAMLRSRWWDTPTPLYRAEIVRAAGPWSELRMEEDWEYDCRIAAAGVKLSLVEEWVVEVRTHNAPQLSGHRDPAVLRDRARAHALILAHGRRAGLSSSPEMRHFARELFHLTRQCDAAGLREEARRLFALAREVAPSWDARVYGLVGRAIGWRRAGRLSMFRDRF